MGRLIKDFIEIDDALDEGTLRLVTDETGRLYPDFLETLIRAFSYATQVEMSEDDASMIFENVARQCRNSPHPKTH